MATVTKTIGTASRDYSTITLWEADLGDTLIYSSGDDIVGECYNDTVFQGNFSLNETSLSKNSVTLTVATGERHDGTLGTGVEVYWDNIGGVLLGDLSVTSHATVEWIIFDTEYIFTSLDAGYCFRVDVSNWRILNCILNKKRRNKSIGTPKAIHEYLDGALIANNIIQYWGRTSGVSYTPVAGYAIRKEHSNNNSQYFNNTIWDNYYGISVSGTANTDVRNNISQGTAFSAYHGTITTEDYNIADDTTTTGTNSINSVAASSLFVSTVFGSEDLHILSGSDADGNGVDLSSVAPSAVYDIDGYDRSSASSWDIGADQYVSPTIALNSNIGLFLAGPTEEGASLFARGANVLNIDNSTTYMPLFMARQPEGFASLHIGNDNFSSGVLTLYTDGLSGGGGLDKAKIAPLYLQGTPNNAIRITSTPSLYIDGPEYDDYNDSIPLFVSREPNVVVQSEFQLFASGALPISSNPILTNTTTSLFIRNEEDYNNDTTLHIETDFDIGQNSPLFIKNQLVSGVVPLNIEGRTDREGSIDLIIRPPMFSKMTLFNSGFRE